MQRVRTSSSKSLQILPEKFHGLTDADVNVTVRDMDSIMNCDSKRSIYQTFKNPQRDP